MADKKNTTGDPKKLSPDYANDQLGENETEYFKKGCGCSADKGKSGKK